MRKKNTVNHNMQAHPGFLKETCCDITDLQVFKVSPHKLNMIITQHPARHQVYGLGPSMLYRMRPTHHLMEWAWWWWAILFTSWDTAIAIIIMVRMSTWQRNDALPSHSAADPPHSPGPLSRSHRCNLQAHTHIYCLSKNCYFY